MKQKIKEVLISETVKSIGKNAVSGCFDLQNINVLKGNPFFSSVDGVLFDKELSVLISFCGGRTGSYQIPGNVQNIGEFAFSACSVEQLVISNDVITIKNNAFEECSALKDIIFSNRLKHIQNNAFNLCESLISVKLPDGVCEIGASAFSGCRNLKNIFMPSSITKMGEQILSDCPNLKNIVIPVQFQGEEEYLGLEEDQIKKIEWVK